jgi:hypothetical protein
MRYRLLLSLVLAAAATLAHGQEHVSAPTMSPEMRCDTCGGDAPPSGNGGGTPAPTKTSLKVSLYAVTPKASTVEFRSTNGVVMVINMASNMVTISNAGHSAQVPLSQGLLQYANGDATKAAAMQARLQAMVAAPKRTAKLAPKPPGTASVNRASLMAGQSLANSARMAPNLFPGPGEGGFGCDGYYDCDIMDDGDFGNWGPYSFGFWADPANGNTTTPDYTYWDHFRQDKCNRKTSDASLIAGGSLVALGSCATVEFGGATAAICVGSYILAVDSMENYVEDDAACNASYPGPGNW